MNTDLEQKRKRIENIVKVVGLCAVGFFVAPFIFVTIQGLVGLAVAAVVGLGLVNVGIPWFAVKMANWRLKALKHEASLNPIETLENQYSVRAEALNQIRNNLKEFYGVVQELAEQIKSYKAAYPDKTSQFEEKYHKMLALYQLRASKYKASMKQLEAFNALIEEKRVDWRVAQSAAKAMKLANVGEDFQSRLMEDSALTSVQEGLNFAFSELEVSLLDEPPTPVLTVTTEPAKTTSRQRGAIENTKTTLSDHAFDLEEAQVSFVKA